MYKEFRRLLKHSLIYGLGNIMRRAVGFLLIPVYTRYFQPKDYGVLELLSITSTMAGIFIGMGLSSAVLRFYFEYDDERSKKRIISTALLTSFLVVFTATFILFRFSDVFSRVFFNSAEYTYFFNLIFIIMFFETTIEIPFAYVRAREQSITFVLISLLRLIVAFGLAIYLVVFLKMGILGVLYSNLAAIGLAWFMLVLITFNYCRVNFSSNKLIKIIKYGTPLILVSCGMYIINSADRIFLNKYSTLAMVGLYSLGYRFGILLRFLVVQPFYTGYGPFRFFIMKNSNAKEIYSRVLTYFSFFLIFIGLLIMGLNKEILAVMTTPAFYEAYKVVPMIVLGVICYGAYFICQIGIYIEKKTKSMAYIVMGVTLLNLLLNWLLIPRFGMVGAAWVNFLSYFALVVITHIISQKYYPIKYEYSRIIKLVIIAVLFYLFCLLINIQDIFVSIFIKTLLICLFPCTLFLVNFYRDEEIKRLRAIKGRILLFLLNKRTKNIYRKDNCCEF